MSDSDIGTIEFVKRLVTERHSALIGALDDFLNELVTENEKSKKEKAQIVLTSANKLIDTLSQQDTPSWLTSIPKFVGSYANDSLTSQQILSNLINHINYSKRHDWNLELRLDDAFDFDKIYEEYRNQGKIPELFEKIIQQLILIRDSGAVDSISLMNALNRVISTLDSNKNGSYFSINSAWEFFISFLNKYLWKELGKLPVLGSAFEALKEVIDETNNEMFSLHSNIQQKLQETIESDIKGLENRTQFNFLSYNKSGHTIEHDYEDNLNEEV